MSLFLLPEKLLFALQVLANFSLSLQPRCSLLGFKVLEFLLLLQQHLSKRRNHAKLHFHFIQFRSEEQQNVIVSRGKCKNTNQNFKSGSECTETKKIMQVIFKKCFCFQFVFIPCLVKAVVELGLFRVAPLHGCRTCSPMFVILDWMGCSELSFLFLNWIIIKKKLEEFLLHTNLLKT